MKTLWAAKTQLASAESSSPSFLFIISLLPGCLSPLVMSPFGTCIDYFLDSRHEFKHFTHLILTVSL